MVYVLMRLTDYAAPSWKFFFKYLPMIRYDFALLYRNLISEFSISFWLFFLHRNAANFKKSFWYLIKIWQMQTHL